MVSNRTLSLRFTRGVRVRESQPLEWFYKSNSVRSVPQKRAVRHAYTSSWLIVSGRKARTTKGAYAKDALSVQKG